MPRTTKLADIGVPVPTTVDPTQILVVYYGPKGYSPSYSDAARIEVGPVSGLTVKTVGGVSYWDDPVSSELPASLPNGAYDFHFTLETADKANEGDFSPAFTATVNNVVPPTLGQPIELS